MQVGHDDHVDVLGPHATGGEVAQQLAPRNVRRIGRPRPEAGVDEDGATVGADQVGAEVEAHLVRVQMRLVGRPLALGNGREEVAEIELEHAVREGEDLDVADAQRVHARPRRDRRASRLQGPPPAAAR